MNLPSSYSVPPLNNSSAGTLGRTCPYFFFIALYKLNVRFLVILGLSITGAFTQIVKITIGRPRPGRLSESPQFLI
jgi:hypothetical protein